jgi:iron-sulfur cluster repair protein YtfE (RIC family)
VRLEHHLLTEEVGLFPLVRQAAAGRDGSRAGTSATAAYHIRHLRHEHEAIEQDAARVRELLAVAAPQGGQEPALRAFARLLDELGADLAEHVKLEEEVLFPRLVAD